MNYKRFRQRHYLIRPYWLSNHWGPPHRPCLAAEFLVRLILMKKCITQLIAAGVFAVPLSVVFGGVEYCRIDGNICSGSPDFLAGATASGSAGSFSTSAMIEIHAPPGSPEGQRAPRYVVSATSDTGGEFNFLSGPDAPIVREVNFYVSWSGDVTSVPDGGLGLYNYYSVELRSPYGNPGFIQTGESFSGSFGGSLRFSRPLGRGGDPPGSVNYHFLTGAAAGTGFYFAGGVHGSASASTNLNVTGVTITTDFGERVPAGGWCIGCLIPPESSITLLPPNSILPRLLVEFPVEYKQGPRYENGGPLWGSDQLDHAYRKYPLGHPNAGEYETDTNGDPIPETLSETGCVLTGVAAILASLGKEFAPGVPIDPGSLNAFLANPENYEPGVPPPFVGNGRLNYGPAIQLVGSAVGDTNLKFHAAPDTTNYSRNQTNFYLDAQLASGNPVLVRVRDTNRDDLHHTVIVTGRVGDTYTISDPNPGSFKTLLNEYEEYKPTGVITGGIQAPPLPSEERFGTASTDPPEIGEIDIAVSGLGRINLLVTDASGNQTGIDHLGGELNDIPASGHYGESTGNIETGEAPTDFAQFVQLLQPGAGDTFLIELSNADLTSSPFSLNISAFAPDGSAMWTRGYSGTLGPSSSANYSFVATIAGDFDNSGAVDASDFVVWRKGLTPPFTPDDYATWRANFGRSTQGTTALRESKAILPAVPEPACCGLLMISAFSLAATRFKRGRRSVPS